ncbi:MAG TPA: HAMP domain-containing sensor histidine kinase, partial [Cytophagaceae bacterium]|nr:HAMP domain-containing sensor histidine kinase [Cytophagaceae bacterium]
MQISLNGLKTFSKSNFGLIPLPFEDAISIESSKIQEFMLLCLMIIFPLFAFFDYHTIRNEYFTNVTSIRFIITIAIGIGWYLQKKFRLNHFYLNYFSFLSISAFCAYSTFVGGKEYLYEHNLASCTVFLAASLFFIWHWKHSITIVLLTVLVYLIGIQMSPEISLQEIMVSGGSVLMTIMFLFPIVVAYKYQSFKKEFLLRKTLEESSMELLKEKTSVDLKNQELTIARSSLDKANSELLQINSSLESIIKDRTKNLQETNAELKQILDELDLFLYSSYHDLKGPIARLMGLANLAKKEVKEDIAHFYVDKFVDNIQEMQLLMQKFNIVNTINSKKVLVEKIDFNAIINELNKKYQLQFSTINFKFEINGETPFYSDRELLGFALHKIIENSLIFRKNNDDDFIKLTISVSNANARISIYDNGIGIPESVINNVFQMFYRGHEISKGHGLGLYMAKKACDKTKSSIKVISVEDKFTEVVLLLPNKNN